MWTWAISRKDHHLHVHVQRYFLVNSRKWRKLCSEIFKLCNIRQKVSIRMWVISETWLWEKVVWNSQAKWWMEQSCWDHDDQSRWKRASKISSHQSFGKPLQRKWRNRWFDSAHGYLSQSAQYQRSSRRFAQRIRFRLCWKWDLWNFGGTDWECPW